MLDNGKAEGVRKIKRFEKYCLKDIATVSQGFTFSRLYQGKKNLKWNYFKVADIGLNPNSKYLTNAINTISDITMEEIGALPFPKGSIVFPRVGAALFNNNKKILAQDGVVDDNVLVLTVTDTSKCWYEFLYYYLQGIPLAKWCNSGLVPVINTKTVLSQMVFLPPLPEQQKIAAILSTQDKVIELKEKLLVQKQQRKRYLMQQLLTGKKRLPGFNGEWQFVKLENVSKYSASAASFKTYESHLGCGPYPVYDATGCFGNIDFYENEQPYISIVKDGAGAGRVALCKAKSSTIGTLGCIFANDIDLLYLFYWMSAVDFQIYSNGSTIPHVYYKDYKNVQVHLPCRLEQEAIVKILSTADHEIDLLQESIEAEKQKKKALMQLLLTGKVRVK